MCIHVCATTKEEQKYFSKSRTCLKHKVFLIYTFCKIKTNHVDIAHMVHIVNKIQIKNGVYILVEISFWYVVQHNKKTGQTLQKQITNKPRCFCSGKMLREKGRDLTQSCDKNPYTQRTIQKATWQHKNATKTMITQLLLTDLGRSVWVTAVTQMAWLNQLTSAQPSH